MEDTDLYLDAGPMAIGFIESARGGYSTVTLLARFRGWSTSFPLATAIA